MGAKKEVAFETFSDVVGEQKKLKKQLSSEVMTRLVPASGFPEQE